MNVSRLLAVFFQTLLLMLTAQLAMAGGLFKDEDVIWQSGQNVYFRYETQEDPKKYGLNDHPVELQEKDVALAMESLRIWDKKFLTTEGEANPVFSISESNRIGKFIALGLKKARPNQDIVFVVESSRSKLILLEDSAYTAGRAFYKDGKLNLIIGEYQHYRNKAFESAYDPGGQGKSPYFLSHGSRASSTGNFSEPIIKVPGVENKRLNKIRDDWFVIDVKLAAESYLAEIEALKNPNADANKRFMEEQAAKMARERRELRLEMARMRKEMEQDKPASSGDSGTQLEQRLKTLEGLREKELISKEEYETKREEILNDI